MQTVPITTVRYGSQVALQVWDGRFVLAHYSWPHPLRATAERITDWETFTVVPTDPSWDAWGWWVCYGHKIALRAANGCYIQADYEAGGLNSPQNGELHAYDYTKVVEGWETFEVVAIGSEPPANTPVEFGSIFALKAHGGQFVQCHMQSPERQLVADVYWTREWEQLRFIHPLLFGVEETIKAHRSQLDNARRLEKEKDDELRRTLQKARDTDKEVTKLKGDLSKNIAEAADAEKHREQDLQRRESKVIEREDTLRDERQEFEASLNDEAALMQLLQNLVDEREEVRRGCEARLKTIGERNEKIEGEIEATQQKIREVEVQIDKAVETQRECQRLLAQEQENLHEVGRQSDNLAQQRSELEASHAQAAARLADLTDRESQLRELGENLEELRLQISIVEARLTPVGLDVEAKEARLQELARELVALSEETWNNLRPEVREVMEEARRAEEKLFQTETELSQWRDKFQSADVLRSERLAALRLYHESNEVIAAHPAIKSRNLQTSDPREILNEVEQMLRVVDSALGTALRANEAASALPVLTPGVG